MELSPEIVTVAERIRTHKIGGAADMAKEAVAALKVFVSRFPKDGENDFQDALMANVVEIMKVTPSFAPPINALHRIVGTYEMSAKAGLSFEDCLEKVSNTCDEMQSWMKHSLSKIGEYGAAMIKDGDTVFTYSTSGSVWAILMEAKKAGKKFRVICTESRPGNEGLWTVRDLLKENIPVEVSIDACIGVLLPQSDIAFVGADCVSSTGTVLCKVGTYPAALVAKNCGTPFYIAADTMKFDSVTLLGIPFRAKPLERYRMLKDDELSGAPAAGTTFDVTPPELLSGIITEKGVVNPITFGQMMMSMPSSESINKLIPSWIDGTL